MKDFFAQLSPYMNNFPELEWLHQVYSRINWQIVKQFINSGESHLNKNWPSEFPLMVDGTSTKDFATSNPFLTWDQQINLFNHTGIEIIWPKRQDIINPVVASIGYSILAIVTLFFLFALSVCVWQIYRYVYFVQEALSYKEITWFLVLQTFFTLSPFLIAILAAGIYGLKCIFFVFSLIGFALAVIFIVDLAARSELKDSTTYSARKIK